MEMETAISGKKRRGNGKGKGIPIPRFQGEMEMEMEMGTGNGVSLLSFPSLASETSGRHVSPITRPLEKE